MCERDLSARALDIGARAVTSHRESARGGNNYEQEASHCTGAPVRAPLKRSSLALPAESSRGWGEGASSGLRQSLSSPALAQARHR